jgi:hypothetical protein
VDTDQPLRVAVAACRADPGPGTALDLVWALAEHRSRVDEEHRTLELAAVRLAELAAEPDRRDVPGQLDDLCRRVLDHLDTTPTNSRSEP